MMGSEFCRKCSVAKHPTTSEKNSVKQITTVRLDSIQIQFQYHPICLPHANQNPAIERKSSEKVCLLAFVFKNALLPGQCPLYVNLTDNRAPV